MSAVQQITERMWLVLDDSPAWEADVLCDDEGNPLRWNGWIASPRFSRETAEKIADYINGADDPAMVEADRFVWVGDVLVQFRWDGVPFGEGEPSYTRELHRPDDKGRYAVGAWSWVWYEAPTAACRMCGWSKEYGYADGDTCPDCGAGFDWAGDV